MNTMAEYQNIIVIVIIAVALIVAGLKIYRSFTHPLDGCSGCESDCSGCDLQDLKKEIEDNKRKKEATASMQTDK